jgi:hypothetical protein
MASVDQTNGSSLSENRYIARLYAGFRWGSHDDYLIEHTFNQPEFPCFVANE